jgi:hypothetical protein
MGEGSDYFAGSGINGTVTIGRSSSEIEREPIAADRSAHLFNLGEERVEILALRAGLFSQSRLHQTAQAKSVMRPHHTATVWALVVVMRGG